MSTRRFHETYSTRQKMGTNGRAACLQCEGDVTEKRRSTFCSRKCATDFTIKTSAGAARRAVFERDKGVCAKCGTDTLADRKSKPHPYNDGYYVYRNSGHLWQADHIRPVVEGGGECGIENYRTLCTACHKAETAELARRRASARRQQSSQETGQQELGL